MDIQQTLGLNPDYPVTNRTISILIFDTLGQNSNRLQVQQLSLKVTQPLGCALCTERIPVRDGRASHHPEHLIMKLRIIFAFFFFLIYKVDHLHDTNFKQLSSPVTDGSVYIDESAKSVGEIISAFQS